MPTGSNSIELRRRAAEVLAEHVVGLPAGGTVDLEGLCGRNPDLSSELRRLTAHWEQVEAVVDALGSGGRIHARLAARFGEEVDPGLSLDEVGEDEGGPEGDGRAPSTGGSVLSGTVRRLEERGPASDRYESRREIARGGMGRILEVWDSDLRRTLAMKVALARGERRSEEETDGRMLARFLEEAQVTAQLDHPGILPVHELGLDPEGQVFFTMPLVKGRELTAILDLARNDEEGWNVTRALSVVLKVCEAMAYAHSKNVVHRDLKPANVMVGRFGEVYVMDWGLAKVIGREDAHDVRVRDAADDASKSFVRTERAALEEGSPLITMDGDVVGTPSYMSPEQARGELEIMGPASDVYSIGCILYQLLAGHMPYVAPGSKANAYAVWGMLQSGPPTPLRQITKSVPDELISICEKAMRRDVAARYPDTTALADDLRAYLEGRVVSAHETGAIPELRKWVKRNRPLASTAAIAFVAVTGGLAYTAKVQLQWQGELSEKESQLDKLTDDYREKEAEVAALEGTAREKTVAATALEREAAASREAAREAVDEVQRQAEELERKQRVVDAALAEVREQSYIANLIGASVNLEAGNYDELYRRLDAAPMELRGWEWNYLSLGQNPGLWREPGKTASIVDAGDGQLLQGLLDGRLVLRDADDGSERSAWGANELGIASLTASPAHGFVAAGGLDGSIRIWNLDDASERAWSAGAAEVAALAFTADGTRLVTVDGYRYQRQFTGVLTPSEPDACALRVWNVEDGTLVSSFVAHARPITSLVLLPDGRAATASLDRRIGLWDLAGEVPPVFLEGHGNTVHDLAVTSDGTRLLSASEDRSVLVWDLAAGARLGDLSGHEEGVLAVDVSPDGRRAVTAGRDRTVRIWDLAAREPLSTLRGHEGEVSDVVFGAQGQRIYSASYEDGVRAWDVNTSSPRTMLGRLDHRLQQLPLEYDDRQGGAPSPLWVADLDDHDSDPPFLTESSAVLGPDGWLAHLGRKRRLRKSYKIDVWDVRTMDLVTTLTGHEDRITAMSWSASGRWLASSSDDRTVRLWDVETGLGTILALPADAIVEALAFARSGARLAVGHGDGRVSVIDVETGNVVPMALPHDGSVRVLAWDETGERLASGSADHSIFVWRAADGVDLNRLRGHGDDLTCLAFHPDGVRLFSGSMDQTLRVWHSVSGATLAVLDAFRYPVAALGFEREGRRLITSEVSRPPIVRVWDSTLVDAQDMWREGEWARRAQALLNDLFARNTSPDEVRAEVLRSELEPQVETIALRLLARWEG